jgi:L-alanine-DL-glutamate epimerase-like enolase superfamily enzyme
MKIAKVEALRCDGGWRPWTFVRMETDGGLVAWGESGRLCHGDGATSGVPAAGER